MPDCAERGQRSRTAGPRGQSGTGPPARGGTGPAPSCGRAGRGRSGAPCRSTPRLAIGPAPAPSWSGGPRSRGVGGAPQTGGPCGSPRCPESWAS
eukprot:9489457-Pyramimonas_sp.AAC.2